MLQISIEGDDSSEALLQRTLESRHESGAITPTERMTQHVRPVTEVYDASFDYFGAPVRRSVIDKEYVRIAVPAKSIYKRNKCRSFIEHRAYNNGIPHDA